MDNHRLKIIAVLVTGLAAFAVAANSPYYGVKPDENTGTAEGHISGKWGVSASSQTADSYTITLDGPTGKGTFYTVESGTVTANHVQSATLQTGTAAVSNALTVGQSATIGANASIGGNASVTGNIAAQGNLSTQGNLNVQGTGNVTGMLNANGGITSTTGTFSGAVNAAVVNVATGSGAGIVNTYNGDVAIGGDLDVTYTPYTAVMAHMDGAEGAAAIPNSVSPATFTVLNAGYITQTNKKFGSASFYMLHWNDGTLISSLPQISSNTFTIDFWVYTAGCPNWQTARAFLVLNPNWTTAGGADMYNAATNNALAMSHTNYNGNDMLMISGPGCGGGSTNFYWSSYNGGWHHVALVRQTYAGGLTLYVDGISKLSNICVGANLDVSAGAYVGFKQTRNQDSYTTASAVYMDELRIDVGVARWSSNFSPPNAPYYQAADRGRLLIGNTAIASPGARLHVANSGYGRAAQIDAANGDIAFNAGGGVLLGNSQYAPTAALDVRPNGSAYVFAAYGDTAGSNLLVSVSTAGRAAFANTITETYGIAAATGAFSGAVTAASFSGAGSGITGLNASNLASGTVADARLSANVPLLNANQTFTGATAFAKTITETYGISASTAQIALIQGTTVQVTLVQATTGQFSTVNATYGITASTAQITLIQATTAQATLMQATTGQFAILNATNSIQLNGANINDAGTLSNVAYKNQDNNFAATQTFQSSVTAYGSVSGYSVQASTGVFAYMGIGGAAFYGAKTHAELQSLACITMPCMAVSSDSPYELFVATGTEAGQWQGQTSEGGP